MQTEKRQHAAVMIERLLAAPYQYRFAKLLNILVRMLRQQGVPYAQAFSQVLRFRNSLSLAFPAREIESMQVEPIDAASASESRSLAYISQQHSLGCLAQAAP